jgi:hyperosmotically inducible periplasmic protein
MKTSFLVTALVAGALGSTLAYAADPATTPSQGSTQGMVKDSPMAASVTSALQAETAGNFADVQVSTDSSGTVFLKGNVATQAEADKAISIAKGTPNVKSVHSDLIVKPKY